MAPGAADAGLNRHNVPAARRGSVEGIGRIWERVVGEDVMPRCLPEFGVEAGHLIVSIGERAHPRLGLEEEQRAGGLRTGDPLRLPLVLRQADHGPAVVPLTCARRSAQSDGNVRITHERHHRLPLVQRDVVLPLEDRPFAAQSRMPPEAAIHEHLSRHLGSMHGRTKSYALKRHSYRLADRRVTMTSLLRPRRGRPIPSNAPVSSADPLLDGPRPGPLARDALLAAIAARLGLERLMAEGIDITAARTDRLSLAAVQLPADALADGARRAVADLEQRGSQAPLYWASSATAFVSADHVLAWHDAIAELTALVLAGRSEAQLLQLGRRLMDDDHAA
jgi:hypothetical protein